MNKNIMLVGLGPHSKRIYMNYFKNHGITPKILVDLESNKEYVRKYFGLYLINIKIVKHYQNKNIILY